MKRWSDRRISIKLALFCRSDATPTSRKSKIDPISATSISATNLEHRHNRYRYFASFFLTASSKRHGINYPGSDFYRLERESRARISGLRAFRGKPRHRTRPRVAYNPHFAAYSGMWTRRPTSSSSSSTGLLLPFLKPIFSENLSGHRYDNTTAMSTMSCPREQKRSFLDLFEDF